VNKNSDVSENAGKLNPQDVLAQPLLSKGLTKGPLKEKWRFNKKDFSSFFPFFAVGPTPRCGFLWLWLFVKSVLRTREQKAALHCHHRHCTHAIRAQHAHAHAHVLLGVLCAVLYMYIKMIPVVVNGPVGLPPPRSADVAPVPLVAVLL
jgi:hypothetical protein